MSNKTEMRRCDESDESSDNESNANESTPLRRPYSDPALRWYELGIISWANDRVRPYIEEMTRLDLLAARYLGVLSVMIMSSVAAAHAQDRGTQETILIVAAAADLVSTEYVLADVDGAYERNPLMGNRAVRIAGKTAVTGLIIWGARELEADGHERAAKWLRICTATAWLGAAGWNVSLTVRY